MGGFSAQVQQPTNPPPSSGGKGGSQIVDPGYSAPQQPTQPMGKGGNYQDSATSGQPRIGQQNPYPNTIGQWDNAHIVPTQPTSPRRGKGKGA